jgi:hypothetical protein
MTTEIISPDLKAVLRRLKLSRILDTLLERLALAPARSRYRTRSCSWCSPMRPLDATGRPPRCALSMGTRALDAARIVGPGGQGNFDRALLNELASPRFIEAQGPRARRRAGRRGRPFLAHVLGQATCRRGYSVLALRADGMLKAPKHARLDNTYEASCAS